MIPALPVLWSGFTGWIAKNPIVLAIGALLIAILGWEKVKSDIKSAARKAERDAIAVKQAEVAQRQAAHQNEVIQEERSNADQALQARDSSPHYPTYDSLPDDQKRFIKRRDGGVGGS